MPSGGARNRSGPAPDPSSGRSDRRGLNLSTLPSEGYSGVVPAFPLQPIQLFHEYMREREKVTEYDEGRTLSFREREADVWAEAWSTPQAAAWALESWRWPIVAEYCRLKTVVEHDPSASAALVAQLHRYRDQIGLTPAGMKENGWKIAPVEVGKQPEVPQPVEGGEQVSSARPRRLRAAP